MKILNGPKKKKLKYIIGRVKRLIDVSLFFLNSQGFFLLQTNQ